MNKYELLFIVSQDLNDEQRESLITKVKSMIENKKGIVESVDKWGMKKFAYPINFKREGFYVLMNVSLNPEFVNDLDKLMTITDGIVRQMFVRK